MCSRSTIDHGTAPAKAPSPSASAAVKMESPSPASGPSPSRLRLLRLVTLLCLLLSDGTYTVLRRYSRGVLLESYSVNEVLMGAEFIKLSFSCYMMSGGCGAARLMNLLLRSKKMLILAAIYGLGNVLSYYALARVGAGTFVVIANLKTLTTAGFSASILGRSYSWTKWRSLLLLVAGVILFILPTLKSSKKDDEEELSSDSTWGSDTFLGIGVEIIVVTLSGFASIYFEKAIKNDPFDIWERNVQLGFYSIMMYMTLIACDKDKPLLSNWTPTACILSFLGATGGLLVALSIKYGDSVLKTLAISGSIIYASCVDHIFLGGPMNGQMGLSALVVVIAVLNYNFDATPADSTPHATKIPVDMSTKDHDVTKNDVECGRNEKEEMRRMVANGKPSE